MKLSFTLETITPEEAARILAEHDEAVVNGKIPGRPLDPSKVLALQLIMLAGQWERDRGDTLKFETLDRHLHGKYLLDGVNRLESCRQAGVKIEFYVARGVSRAERWFIESRDEEEGPTRDKAVN